LRLLYSKVFESRFEQAACVQANGDKSAAETRQVDGWRICCDASTMAPARQTGFPASAGVLLGLGLGGFFDGIVLHQVLQWHHMVTSAGYPPTSVANLEFNTLLDGCFHAATWIFVVAGVAILWRHAHRPHVRWSTRLLAGSLLVGFGAFNVVEGIVDHQLLGLHHVNETVPPDQWIYWDMGFLAWGALMLLAGWYLLRKGREITASAPMKA
jgi:uncharacterized membrane protein